MNDALAELCAAAAATALGEIGYAGSLIPRGAGEPVTLAHIGARELPASRVQMQYGQDDQRLADLVLLRAELGAVCPGKDDQVVLDSGPQAGTWTVLGVESQDIVAFVVRGRKTARASAAAPGVKVVRR